MSDTLAAVLKEEPDWNGIPAKVRPLLQHCLEKDPKRRLRDIGDMACCSTPLRFLSRHANLGLRGEPWRFFSWPSQRSPSFIFAKSRLCPHRFNFRFLHPQACATAPHLLYRLTVDISRTRDRR